MNDIWRQIDLASQDGYMHFWPFPNEMVESNVHRPMDTAFFEEVYRLKREC